MARGHSPLPAAAGDFDQRVRQIVRLLLPHGCPDVRIAAHAVRTSTRTLQRRLSEAGLTFVGVVQQVRCAGARRMLRDPDRKITDIAHELGYSDPAHFTRAFTRWTGIPPTTFRRRGGDGTKHPRPRRGRRRR